MKIAYCSNKFRDKSNKITLYELTYKNEKKVIKPEELKKAIKDNQITVTNLKLTSDGRLVENKQYKFGRYQNIETTEFINYFKNIILESISVFKQSKLTDNIKFMGSKLIKYDGKMINLFSIDNIRFDAMIKVNFDNLYNEYAEVYLIDENNNCRIVSYYHQFHISDSDRDKLEALSELLINFRDSVIKIAESMNKNVSILKNTLSKLGYTFSIDADDNRYGSLGYRVPFNNDLIHIMLINNDLTFYFGDKIKTSNNTKDIIEAMNKIMNIH